MIKASKKRLIITIHQSIYYMVESECKRLKTNKSQFVESAIKDQLKELNWKENLLNEDN